MLAHPDEFRFFLPSVGGEDAEGATDHEGVMTEQEYAKYCHNIETTGEWGGEPEVNPLLFASSERALLENIRADPCRSRLYRGLIKSPSMSFSADHPRLSRTAE